MGKDKRKAPKSSSDDKQLPVAHAQLKRGGSKKSRDGKQLPVAQDPELEVGDELTSKKDEQPKDPKEQILNSAMLCLRRHCLRATSC